MKKDDIVVAFGKKEIKDASTLRNEVAISPIGQEVNVRVLRGGKEQELAVTVGNQEDATKLLSASVKERLGVEVREVSSEEAGKYGLEPREGAAVAWIDPKGPFGQAGFEVDDVVLQINDQSIEGVDSFVSVVSTLKPRQKIAVLALDHRSGSRGHVEVVAQ
jgi:serine protease Do